MGHSFRRRPLSDAVSSAGVEPVSPSWNLVHRRGIRFVVVESGSSSLDLRRRRTYPVDIGSSSSLNLLRRP
jgi:hypothetical protein